MSQESRPVLEAIDRWEAGGLVAADLALSLREEVAERSSVGTVRLTQYLLASVAAVLVLIAAGVFLEWAWPLMATGLRSGVLAVAGVGMYVWGARMEGSGRWLPASLLMQTAGLGLLLGATLYDRHTYTGGPVGIAWGVIALGVPIVLAPRSFRNSVVMPAVHLCFGLAFLAVFLDRAVGLDGDAIVWVLDGVLVISALGLVRTLRADPAGERHPWALNAFVAAVYAGFFMVLVTGLGPLDLEEASVYPLDFWLGMVVALSLWGIHRAPPDLRREWFGTQLAYAIAMWIPLGIYTATQALGGPTELALLLVGGAGVAGFAYAVHFRVRRVLSTSALAFVVAVWYWAVDRAGALGAVLALALTAAVLFRLSGRIQSWLGDTPPAE